MGTRKVTPRTAWSAADVAVLARRFPHEPTAAVAAALGRTMSAVSVHAAKLGLKKSAAYLQSPAACRMRRGDNLGAEYRFPKGHVPANKGLRRPGWSPGRMSETQFRKGERSGIAARNWRPVGTVLEDTDGYLRIKVREAHPGEAYGFGNVRVWPLMQRHVWEQAHGPIPPGHAIAFRNRDKKDTRLENLELITRAELMSRNSVHNLPQPLASTIQLLGALKRQIRKRTKAHDSEQDRTPA